MTVAEAIFLLVLPAAWLLLLVAIAVPLEGTAHGRRLTAWLLRRLG